MRTAAKVSLVRQSHLELELADELERVEEELYRAGAELDRFYAELERDVERDRRRAWRKAARA